MEESYLWKKVYYSRLLNINKTSPLTYRLNFLLEWDNDIKELFIGEITERLLSNWEKKKLYFIWSWFQFSGFDFEDLCFTEEECREKCKKIKNDFVFDLTKKLSELVQVD